VRLIRDLTLTAGLVGPDIAFVGFGVLRVRFAAADVLGAKSFIGLSAADVALDPGALLFQFLHSAGVAARASAFYLLIQALDLLAIIRDPGLLVPEN